LKSLGVTKKALPKALLEEQRPAIRKRLIALTQIVKGRPVPQAARAAKVGEGSVYRWLKQVRHFPVF
jgi:transposase